MRIVQASPSDQGGGAERIAVALHEGYRGHGHESTLYLGRRHLGLPGTRELSNGRGLWRLHDRLRRAGRARESRIVRAVVAPGTLVDTLRGREDFVFPGSSELVERATDADVVQLHNLHGAYFDLRLLARLAALRPVVLSPQDAWLASGHCAHSLGCDRWRTGCGSCPELASEAGDLRPLPGQGRCPEQVARRPTRRLDARSGDPRPPRDPERGRPEALCPW
jgi:hypothetical protein